MIQKMARSSRTLADVFLSRAILAPALLLVLQQVIVASSTIWLTRFAAGVAGHAAFGHWLLLYLASLSLPYVPGTLVLYTLERWSLDCQSRLLALTDSIWYGKTTHWHDAKERSHLLSLYSKEAPRLLDDFVRYAYSLTSCSLNALFNILTLAVVVEPMLLAAYVVSLVVASIIIRAQGETNERLAEQAQTARLRCSESQLGMWDNTLLGNSYNHAIWYEALQGAFRGMASQVLRASRFSQSVTLLIIAGTQLPVALVLCWDLLLKPVPAAQAIALVVALPRLFQIVNSSHEVLSLIAMWHAQKGKLRILDQLLRPTTEISPPIRYDQLRANNHPLPADCATPADFIANVAPGSRVTLTGANGAGKTTLLLQLKGCYGSDAYYMPAKHTLAFHESTDRASTGQAVIAQLDEIIRRRVAPVLLLDEWDANLDSQHQRALDARLAALHATGVTVIEVRHRAA
jgi:hypothetical protein